MPRLYRDDSIPIIEQMKIEQGLSIESRRWIYDELEKILGRPVISFFTNFNPAVGIEQGDDRIFEDLVRKMDLSNGLILCINSPGGNGIAANKIVRICREYSGTRDFWAMVPGKARSAGTMICMGASKILMGPVSELGPIDPQVPIRTGADNEDIEMVSVQNVIDSHDRLVKQAENARGNPDPYLMQLSSYDERLIDKLAKLQTYSTSYAVKILKSGMMTSCTDAEIKDKISIFTDANRSITHSLPIYREDARDCGLMIEDLDSRKEVWNLAYELYIRTEELLSRDLAKCIESKNFSSIIPYQEWSR